MGLASHMPCPPRYSTRPFPSYRFIPGQAPHPRLDPCGHSFGQPDLPPADLEPANWDHAELYLFGVDLYNFGYWWECHEVFESFWHGTGRITAPARYFRALIQLAAAHLKRSQGLQHSASLLATRGLTRLKEVPPSYLGLDVRRFTETTTAYFSGTLSQPAPILLTLPHRSRRSERE